MQLPSHGLYAITDSLIVGRRFEVIEQALIGGVKMLQYRDKNSNKEQRKTQAKALRRLCGEYKIPLIINDDLKLAQRVDADGVHLGKDDPNIKAARAILGDDAIIGVSCYNQLSLAQQAVEAGATYVAFGRFFPSHTKPQAIPCSVDVLCEARQVLNCPLVAIGGIMPDNGSQLIKAGADFLAVVHGLFGQTDVPAAVQRYAQLWGNE